ncbi:MAG: hypothetical protein ACFCUR_18680 [Rhodomicrobiaceae bacterium]
MTVQAARMTSGESSAGSMILTILLTGVASVIVWELWARAITPQLIGGPLEPAGLVQAVFGLGDRALAEAIHFVTGLIAYPLGYIFIARPVAKTIFPFLPWWMVALGYGAALWVFALYIMAHLIAGFPPFLGFTALAWASLAGHLLFALAGGAVVKARLG